MKDLLVRILGNLESLVQRATGYAYFCIMSRCVFGLNVDLLVFYGLGGLADDDSGNRFVSYY